MDWDVRSDGKIRVRVKKGDTLTIAGEKHRYPGNDHEYAQGLPVQLKAEIQRYAMDVLLKNLEKDRSADLQDQLRESIRKARKKR